MDSADSDSQAQAIRANMRDTGMHSRREHRHQSVDAVRLGLGEIEEQIKELDTITVQDVHGLTSRIKRRRQANEADLVRLSRAFQQNVENIMAFTNTTGALNVIVKELTGNEVDMQLMACECLCNLALGPEVACAKVALAASTYLLTFLESTSLRLKLTSLWTITNLCAADGLSTVKVLVSQKIMPKLVQLLTTTTCSNNEITTQTYMTLNVLFHKHSDLVCSDTDADQMIRSFLGMFQTNKTNSWGIAELIYRALEAYDYQIEQTVRQEIVCSLSDNMLREMELGWNNDADRLLRMVKQCVFSLRAIGNLIVDNPMACSTMRDLVARHPRMVQSVLELDDVLAMDVLWLVGLIGYDVSGLNVPNSVRSGLIL